MALAAPGHMINTRAISMMLPGTARSRLAAWLPGHHWRHIAYRRGAMVKFAPNAKAHLLFQRIEAADHFIIGFF